MRLIIPTLILSTFAFNNIPRAVATDEPNLREICRKRVAGLYLKIHDEAELAGQVLKHNRKSIKTHQQALKKLGEELLKTKSLNKKMPYDSKRFHFEHSLEQKIDLLKENLIHYKTSQKKIIEQLKNRALKKSYLKKKISQIFIFEKRDKNIFGYPFQIMWKSSCPKWRLSCPLDRKTAQKLINIWADATQNSCHKYSNMIH
ncbi:MAG: hypothetical protein AB8C84_06610 [Oligoflexales bacterium]